MDKKISSKKSIVIFIILLLATILVVLFFVNRASSDPWWKGTERILVTECNNDNCTDVEFSEQRYVTYNGDISVDSSVVTPISLTEDATTEQGRIRLAVDENVVNIWRKSIGLKDTATKEQLLSRVSIFDISTKNSGTIRAYGFCYKNSSQKSCIAFARVQTSMVGSDGKQLGSWMISHHYVFYEK